MLLLLLHALLAWQARSPGIQTGGDDALYVLLSRSIRALSYREWFRPEAPVHSMYPPVYPAMLALWSTIGGESFGWLVALSIACSVGALGLTFVAVRRIGGDVPALAALGALSMNPTLVGTAGYVLSEAPYILFQMLALWALVPSRGTPRQRFVAGAASVAAAMTRSVGVTLVAAVALTWVLQRRFRPLLSFALCVVLTVGAWFAWTAVAPRQAQGTSYVADAVAHPSGGGFVGELVRRIKDKSAYAEELYWLLEIPSVQKTRIDNFIAVPVVFLSLTLGLASFAADEWLTAAIYVAAYAGLLIIWPYTVTRFLVPLIPVLVPAMFIGMWRFLSVMSSRFRTAAVAICAALMMVASIPAVASTISEQRGCDFSQMPPPRECVTQEQASLFDTVRYIREHLRRDAILLSGKSPVIAYYTGRRVASLTDALARRPSEFLEYLRLRGVTHVVLLDRMLFSESVPPGGVPLGSMLLENCHHFTLVAGFPPSTYIFEVSYEKEDNGDACQAVTAYMRQHGKR